MGKILTEVEKKKAKVLILNGISNHSNQSKACDAAGVSTRTYYNWRENDHIFADGVNKAMAEYYGG